MTKTIPASLRALLVDLVDYAGLFPPATLDMDSAVRAYAEHRLESRAFMLGRFVVPAGRLASLAESVAGLDADHARAVTSPWPLSVLTGDDPEGARAKVDAFLAAHADVGTVVAVETRAAVPDDVTRAARSFSDAERFVEIPHDQDPSALMQAIAATGSRAKIRTGGITEDAFPTTEEVARFLVEAQRAGIGLKLTAGLHHPLCGAYRLTYESDSDSGRMFGFLGVFLAAAWVHTGESDPARLGALLEADDASDFRFDDDGVTWRDARLSTADLASARSSFARSYGSCSFAEPTGDLESLGLL